MSSSPRPPRVSAYGPDEAWLVELLTYSRAPSKDQWAYFIRSRSRRSVGDIIQAQGDVTAGFKVEFKRGYDFDRSQEPPPSRIALQWIDDSFMNKAAVLGDQYTPDTSPASPFGHSACKIPAPGKTLDNPVSMLCWCMAICLYKRVPSNSPFKENSGLGTVQGDSQTWIVESADQLVRDGIFNADVAVYLLAYKQSAR